MSFKNLLPPSWKTTVQQWLQEDIPSFDYGGFVVGDKLETATLYGKTKGVLSGVPFFEAVFELLNCKVEWILKEGQEFEPISTVAKVTGNAKNILLGERTALNIIARASGIATRARTASKLAQQYNFKGVISGTRKTTPGFRLVEKYSLLVGGADTHRMDLSSMVMLKDNHIVSAGNITTAVKNARKVAGFSIKIEVECQNQKEAEEAIEAGADVVMLDNHKPDDLKRVSKDLKQKYISKSFLIEASGGITLDTLSNFFNDDVDIISLGSLTQSVPHIDYSLKIKRGIND